jgi:hypothetical protein
LRGGSHPLAPHLVFELMPEWQRHLMSCPEQDVLCAASEMAESILPGIEFLFAFSALLVERTCLRSHEVNLTRLNRQRLRKGKTPLLDHAEVRLDLWANSGGRARELAGIRESSRLHVVRGHMVRRGECMFWRRSHFRGDASRSGGSRTVNVFRRLR